MTHVLTRSRPVLRSHRRDLLALMAAAVAALSTLLLTMTPLPATVGEVTVSNPSVWLVQVEVAGPSRTGWLPLGQVGPMSGQSFALVTDPGSEWAFRFSYSGLDGAELAMTRAQLAAEGWSVSVPEEFRAARMRAAGKPPSGTG